MGPPEPPSVSADQSGLYDDVDDEQSPFVGELDGGEDDPNEDDALEQLLDGHTQSTSLDLTDASIIQELSAHHLEGRAHPHIASGRQSSCS